MFKRGLSVFSVVALIAVALGLNLQAVAEESSKWSIPLRTSDSSAYEAAKRQAAADAGLGAAPGSAPTGPSPSISPSFEGLFDTGGTPPDTTGAVGPTRYIEMINQMVGIYSRSGALLSSASLDSFTGFAGLSFDVQIIWDPGTDRFYYAMDQVVLDNPPLPDNRIAWGFSKNSSPSSRADFCHYSEGFGYGAEFPDYPKLGDTKDFLLLGVNVFSPASYVRSEVAWISKPAAGEVTTCPSQNSFLTGRQVVNGFTPVPANQIDPSGTGWVIAIPVVRSGAVGSLLAYQVTRDTLTGSALIEPAGRTLSVNAYSTPPDAPQPGTSHVLDTLDARLTQAVSAVDPSRGDVQAVWTQHTVAGGAGSEVRWYEIDPATAPSPTVLQSGVVNDPSLYVFNGAISPDRVVNGPNTAFGSNMAVGFNTSSTSSNPAIRMVSKLVNDLQSAHVLIKQSASANIDFSCFDSRPGCRWGDYSGASPDPAASTASSAGVVWFANQWNVDGPSQDFNEVDWRTWIWGASLSGGPTVTPGAISGTVVQKQGRKPIEGALVACGTAGSDTTASDGSYSIDNVPPGTYSCTASKTGFTSKTTNVTVKSGGTTRVNFSLNKA